MSSDRRRAPRIEILGRVHGHIVMPVSVTVREISLGGLSLESVSPFQVGAIHEFGLTLGDESSVVLRGRVVHSRADVGPDGLPLYITGVQFIEEESPPGATVGNLLDKIK